ncbi:MAG: bifunctional heptose 7-phosphate kinase/heptose 1-phosphate adenyltransferase [Actinobacteria bacterium]|nr:bifunctional heptose 7-phosphate kinase/heptose 1-phosphate adenyltransferase [Actinomycetota bacterium]
MSPAGTGGPLVVVGDALLDRDVDGQVRRLAPDAPAPVLEDAAPTCRPGGAALAARLAAADGGPVVLVAPLGDDEASERVVALLEPYVTVVRLPLTGALPEKTRFRTGGRTLLRADRGGGRPGAAGVAAEQAISGAGTILVSDYGRGLTADPELRALLARQAARVPLVWDPHPRGASPVPRARLVTPNYAEALAAAGTEAGVADALPTAVAAAQELGSRWTADAVAVTLGERGAVLVQGATAPVVVPAAPVDAADPCGAGDRFAATAAAALRRGALTSEAVTAAVAAATAYLAAGGVSRYGTADEMAMGGSGAPTGTAGTGQAEPSADPQAADAARLAERVRAGGGTVVATGGCFDLLHAGHVSLLQTARSLGDCLIVCLNSDASVRRLKGAGRPLNPAADRAAVLAALGCVDAVAVFAEDTPCAVLDQLRPDIWVKGGDYDGRELPEAARLKTWGGIAVTVPYLSGRSTTRLASAFT